MKNFLKLDEKYMKPIIIVLFILILCVIGYILSFRITYNLYYPR